MYKLVLVSFVAFGVVGCNSGITGSSSVANTESPSNFIATSQTSSYNNDGTVIYPLSGEVFYGQDAIYTGKTLSYTNNNDGTITDNNTGLMWQKSYYSTKIAWSSAVSICESQTTGGYTDWRVPNVHELYSLIQFNGSTPYDQTGTSTTGGVPYLNLNYFDFIYGSVYDSTNRVIDSQYITTSVDISPINLGNGDESGFFGVNFADGRIKSYPTVTNSHQYYFLRCVRGTYNYSNGNYTDNGDDTVTDNNTNLMWMKNDSGYYNAGESANGTMNWADALAYCQNLTFAGESDWRLPNAKELQSIVDYSRSPSVTNSASINAIFSTSSITNEAGESDFPWYWSSTTHLDGAQGSQGKSAVYVTFGRGTGSISSVIYDVHGAGSQRSDPKTGNRSDYPTCNTTAPQGDCERVFNYVRCVRNN